MPDAIEVDISALGLGKSIKVKEVSAGKLDDAEVQNARCGPAADWCPQGRARAALTGLRAGRDARSTQAATASPANARFRCDVRIGLEW